MPILMYLFSSYVTNALLASGNNDNLVKTIEHMKSKYSMHIFVSSSGLGRQTHVFHSQQLILFLPGIRYMVKHQDPLEREEVRKVEEKLEKCRNQENNPESDLLV